MRARSCAPSAASFLASPSLGAVDGGVCMCARAWRSFWFSVGMTGFSGWLLMAAYLIIWVKYIKKFPGDWEDYWPQVCPQSSRAPKATSPCTETHARRRIPRSTAGHPDCDRVLCVLAHLLHRRLLARVGLAHNTGYHDPLLRLAAPRPLCARVDRGAHLPDAFVSACRHFTHEATTDTRRATASLAHFARISHET